MVWRIPLTHSEIRGQPVVRVRIGVVARVRVNLWKGSVLRPVSQGGLGQGWNQCESVFGSVCGHGCGQSEVTLM